jgi:hypothetical protein
VLRLENGNHKKLEITIMPFPAKKRTTRLICGSGGLLLEAFASPERFNPIREPDGWRST